MSKLEISPNAAKELSKLHAEAAPEDPSVAVRLFLAGLGHEGLDWGLALDQAEESDDVCECEGVKIVMETELLQMLGGVSVDFIDDEEGGGFKIEALDPDFGNFDFEGGGCCGGSCGGCGEGCGDGNCGEGGCGSTCGGCGDFGGWDDDEDEED